MLRDNQARDRVRDTLNCLKKLRQEAPGVRKIDLKGRRKHEWKQRALAEK